MEIINRVASSPLITIDLGDFYVNGERAVFDLKDYLYMEQILREKDFRQAVESLDWSFYSDKHVAIHCSIDAIIPAWAYMLIASRLEPYARTIVHGDLTALDNFLFARALDRLNPEEYKDKKIVIKGCGDKPIPDSAYIDITSRLRPHVASIFYGEPCSTVPVYKRPKV